MAITFVSSTQADVDPWNSSNTMVVNVPASIQEDDFLIASVLDADGDIHTIASTGWTELTQRDEGAWNANLWYKKATASEGSTYTWTVTSANVRRGAIGIMAFRGVDTTTPWDVTYVEGDHRQGAFGLSAPTPKPITTNTDGAMVVISFQGENGGTQSAYTQPSGYTEVHDYAVNNFGLTLGTAYKKVDTKGTETPGSYTSSVTDADQALFTLALKPAGGGGTTGVVQSIAGPGGIAGEGGIAGKHGGIAG